MVDFRAILDSHEKIVKVVWLAIHVFAFAFVIAALAVVGDSDSKAFNFAAIWLALLVIAFGIGGSMVLLRNRSAMSIGFMIGSSFMFSMQCLTLAVLAGGNVADPDSSTPSSEKAVVAFSVFLFLGYGLFSLLSALWRDDLIPDEGLVARDSMAGNAAGMAGAAPPVSQTGLPPTDQI